ncbi:hypothetical protein DXT99_02895 [Pontibacter diazotrophicus]|uniref:DUF748 domain-containing protein n=2 Tax=Pontibacter diazotrophicus TaxID=1400979 RepID=A0A3D8LH71_9BACT|nr:hypothetical protein DXT99_02895 [Pontibacter diazotrophicus]
MVGCILLASILLLTVLEPVVGRILKEQVSENTNGLYTLAFEDLQINLLTGIITLEQLHISPDTAVHQEQRSTGAAAPLLFEVETPHFQIYHINLLDALFHNRASIGTVTAERPLITLIEDESIKDDTVIDEQQDGGSLPGFLDALQIGKIDIQDATFRYSTLSERDLLQHEIPQVSLLLREFSIPPHGEPDSSRLFHADGVQLTVRDYTYQAPDGINQLQVGLLSYSSEEATLTAEGIALLPNQQANAALPPEAANQTLYNANVPGLRMTGMDLLEAYRTKQLHVTELLLEKPVLHILNDLNVPATTETADLSKVYKEVSAYLTEIEIGELRLTEGTIKVSESLEEPVTVHELTGTEIALQEIRLDSSTLFLPKNNLFAEALLFSAESYTYQHPFSPHTIITGNLELSTRGNYFHLDTIQVIGDKEKNDRLKQNGSAQPLIYNINAPGLRFSNMDLIQAWQTDSLTIGTIDVLKPIIKIGRDKSVPKADTEAQLQEAYTAVSGFISGLFVENINIHDASFTHITGTGQLKRVQELQHISLGATGLKIDSAYIFTPLAEDLPVEEAVLTAHDYTFWTPDNLYTFTLDRIHYSTRKQLLSARSLALSYNQGAQNRMKGTGDASRNLYDISATGFSVTGLDIIKAIETGELLMDQVLLRQPDFAMLKDQTIPAPQEQRGTMDELYSILNPIKVNVLRMEDGTFTYSEKSADVTRTQLLDHASATVLGLNLGSARLGALDDVLPMQEMNLTAGDYTYRSPDGIYTITLDSLLYSSQQQELSARRIDVASDKEANARLKLQGSEQANRNLFDVSAERFRVRGLDLIQAYETGQFAMAEMLLTAPEVAVLQDRNVPPRSTDTRDEEENTEDSEALEQIAEVVEAFRVDKLRVNDGNVTFNILQDTVMASQSIAHVSVAMDQLRTISLEASDPLEMFRADEIGVLVRDYSYLLPDSLYRLDIGEIRTSLQEQSLYIDSLRLLPLYGRDEFMSRLTYENDRFDVHVPQVQLRGIDLDALFNNQDIIIGQALLLNPLLDIYRDKRIPEDPDRRPPTPQEMLRQVEYYVDVDTITVEGANLTYAEVAPNGEKPGVLSFVDANMEAYNVTNVATLLSQDSIAPVNASALLMGESELSVQFLFHLNHPEDLYTYEGTLQPMDFSALNPLFKNLIFVSIEDGKIDKAAFSVKSTEHMAEGQMRFFYNDFEILLIDEDNPDKPGFLRKSGSWLLNKFIIKSNNPAGRRDLREGNIEVERDYSKSVFNHMGKAMIDGITSSLMVPFVERIADKLIEF